MNAEEIKRSLEDSGLRCTAQRYAVMAHLPGARVARTVLLSCQRNPALLYKLLFRSVSETLLEVAADPQHLGAEIGFLAILHSWGQNLLLHPHLHCLVPVGGLAP